MADTLGERIITTEACALGQHGNCTGWGTGDEGGEVKCRCLCHDQPKEMTVEEAEQVLESASEMDAELGMGFVSGGGSAEDASAFIAQSRTEEQVAAQAEARAVLDEAAARYRRENPPPPPPADADDDLPF